MAVEGGRLEAAARNSVGNSVFGFDLVEKEEQGVCHASALDLAMTDEACQEAEV